MRAACAPLRAQQQRRACVAIPVYRGLWVRERSAALVLAAARNNLRTGSRWLGAGSRAGQAETCEECTLPYAREQMLAKWRTGDAACRAPRARHRQTAVVVFIGGEGTGAVGMWAVGIGRRTVPRHARADAEAVADG